MRPIFLSVESIRIANEQLMAARPANDNGLSMVTVQYGDERHIHRGGFFAEVIVFDGECQIAQFTGPFAKVNALRFMTIFHQEASHA